jgi:hypothetical protein
MNPIEKFFNQLKYYMKRDEPMSYNLIKKSIRKSIKYIELKTYKNYFKSSLTKTKEDINPFSNNGDPYYTNSYFGKIIDLYDVIFFKVNRF